MNKPLEVHNLLDNDEHLLCELQRRKHNGADLWSLPDRDRHDSGHAFFQYPAMMVPAVQRTLVNIIKTVQPKTRNLLDPYVGAGTSLTAGMHNGINSYGQDVNPLAVLVSKVRTGPFYIELLSESTNYAIESAKSDSCVDIAVDFPNRTKWFKDDVSIELSKLKRAIEKDTQLWSRRFLWVTLAETIRLTSNDRTSTYKLHARPQDEIHSRALSPIDVFSQLAKRNLIDLQNYKCHLDEKGYINKGRFTGDVAVAIGDTASHITNFLRKEDNHFDLLITSPPYGDNKTTITYGQHAYLPLQWISFDDIASNVGNSYLDTTMAIDTMSIGGVRSRLLEQQIAVLRSTSKTLAGIFDALISKPQDRIARVAAFYSDFIDSLDNIIPSLKKNAYIVFTIGNRSVGGIEITNDLILRELLESRGAVYVTQLERQIHHKRMPNRNSTTKMMRSEQIIIFRQASALEKVS